MTPAQLATARRCQEEFGLDFPLVEASAEDVRSRPRASISRSPNTGPASGAIRTAGCRRRLDCCGPAGGSGSSATAPCRSCARPSEEAPPGDRLLRAQRGLGRLEWPDEIGVEWQLPHGELFRLLRQTGFDVVDLVELYAPDDARDHAYYTANSAEWARRWPAEEIWVAAKPR